MSDVSFVIRSCDHPHHTHLLLLVQTCLTCLLPISSSSTSTFSYSAYSFSSPLSTPLSLSPSMSTLRLSPPSLHNLIFPASSLYLSLSPPTSPPFLPLSTTLPLLLPSSTTKICCFSRFSCPSCPPLFSSFSSSIERANFNHFHSPVCKKKIYCRRSFWCIQPRQLGQRYHPTQTVKPRLPSNPDS